MRHDSIILLLFFFFKQKTAYEMRISDWSSDVCSSDLLKLATERFDPKRMPRIVGFGDTVSAQTQQIDGKPQVLRGGSDRGFLTLVQDLGKAFRTDNAVLYVASRCGELQRSGQIGRASCRDRECEDGWIP